MSVRAAAVASPRRVAASVRPGPLVGLAAQVALLVLLAATVGLGPAGWATGLGLAVAAAVLLDRGLVGTGGEP